MSYYDSIARQWHKATGFKGGAFKRLVLNDALLERIPDINDRAVLELGAGNGYFLPLVLRRFSGRPPSAIMVTDQSTKLLAIARTHFRIRGAEYPVLDVREEFPFGDRRLDLILATMVFNEVSSGGLKKALKECQRVLSTDGLLLITVAHPRFVSSLRKRGLLKRTDRGVLTMPGSGNLRLPVAPRTSEAYKGILAKSGFACEEDDIFPTTEVLNAKPGLRNTGMVPLALILQCTKKRGR